MCTWIAGWNNRPTSKSCCGHLSPMIFLNQMRLPRPLILADSGRVDTGIHPALSSAVETMALPRRNGWSWAYE